MPTMNKWEVTTDPLTLRRLGKLGEELGELANVASRCIIQGIDATDPGTGKVNRQRLLDELADVAAQIDCTVATFALDAAYFGKRRTTKREQMAEWEALYAPCVAGLDQPQQENSK
jgi:NTP pyrophosphatase (non-canonical NTP hydrolase)